MPEEIKHKGITIEKIADLLGYYTEIDKYMSLTEPKTATEVMVRESAESYTKRKIWELAENIHKALPDLATPTLSAEWEKEFDRDVIIVNYQLKSKVKSFIRSHFQTGERLDEKELREAIDDMQFEHPRDCLTIKKLGVFMLSFYAKEKIAKAICSKFSAPQISGEWEKEFDRLFKPETLHLRMGKFYFKDEKEQIKKFIRGLLNGR